MEKVSKNTKEILSICTHTLLTFTRTRYRSGECVKGVVLIDVVDEEGLGNWSD